MSREARTSFTASAAAGAQTVMGGSYRMRSVPNVMQEIEHVISEYKIRSLLVGDDNFMISKERTLEFCEQYRWRGHHRTVPWQIATRVDSVDRESLRAVKEAGCYLVSFGIESGVGRTLDTAEKGIRAEQSEEAVRLAKGLPYGREFSSSGPEMPFLDVGLSLSQVRPSLTEHLKNRRHVIVLTFEAHHSRV